MAKEQRHSLAIYCIEHLVFLDGKEGKLFVLKL